MSELKTLQVGKKGLTDALVEEISVQLRKHKKVRIRVLRSVELNKNETAEEIANRVGARVLDVRGNTFVLSKL